MSSIKIGINGFGRIGRHLLRISLNSKEIEVVAVNDIADIKTCSHLLKYDSVFGVLDKPVEFDDNGNLKDNYKIKGIVKDGKINFFKRNRLEAINFIFEVKKNKFQLNDLYLKIEN